MWPQSPSSSYLLRRVQDSGDSKAIFGLGGIKALDIALEMAATAPLEALGELDFICSE